MNKKLMVSIFVFVCLVLGFAGTNRVAALSPSGPLGNQVFYSAAIEKIVLSGPTAGKIPNQQLYSPYIGSIIRRNAASLVPTSVFPNQVFYSPFVGNIVKPGLTRLANSSSIANQVFYSSTIEGFLH